MKTKKNYLREILAEPEKVALLVVDMQRDFYAPDGNTAKRGKPVVRMQGVAVKMDRFVKAMADKGVRTVFTRYVSGEGVTPINLKKVADKEGYSLACEKGSGLEEIFGVKVPEGVVVIDKPHFDAFAQTSLLEMLREKGIKTILITGVRTEICVDATAKRATSEGFDTIVISDLVATYDDKEDVHNQVLNFFDKYYGFVARSDIVTQIIGENLS